MHHFSNKNNPQDQGYFSSLKDLKKKKKKKSEQEVIFLPSPKLLLLLYFLNGMCNAKGLKKKNAFQAPAPNPTRESEAKRKRREYKLVAEGRWLPLTNSLWIFANAGE